MQALNAERRMTFTYTPNPKTGDDPGAKLDAEARKIQFASPRPIAYAEAYHIALQQNPELGRAHFNAED